MHDRLSVLHYELVNTWLNPSWLRDRLLRWISYQIPKRLVYWTFLRGCAIVTTGRYGNSNPNELSIMEALKRLENG